jgi:hypothetical protein
MRAGVQPLLPDLNLAAFIWKHCRSFVLAMQVESQNAFWQDTVLVIRGTPGILEPTGIPIVLRRKLHGGWWKPFQVPPLEGVYFNTVYAKLAQRSFLPPSPVSEMGQTS